ncbi:MAG: Obg family GTPase CgtA, partial [Clostridiales bacterium]|nr:Obg family GTPase CgtA [Clostridiales bacterium]
FPNVGKSTLLSVVSSARPKIANYHFTTLKPNLGVVYVDEGSSFVMADIPGLIEGAKDGSGLGHHFLRHVERCRLLVHIVDVSGIEGRDPIEDFETIMGELSSYSEMLSKRKQIVAANKTDIIQDEKAAIRFEEYIREKGYEFFRICAATGENVKTLVNKIALELEKLPPVLIFEPEYVPEAVVEGGSKEISIVREDDVFIVEGKWLYKAMRSVNFDDYESRMYFERVMRKAGVFDRLREMDIKEGDTVSIYDLEFEYIE